MTTTIKIKTISIEDCTVGHLELLGTTFKCFTLELPNLGNAKNISCIPGGHYYYTKRFSPTLGWVIHILDVEGRTWIYIHAGNFTSQIKGCILVGDSIKDINNDGTPDVTGSKATFNQLMELSGEVGNVIIERAKF
jgi:hypothetical protein